MAVNFQVLYSDQQLVDKMARQVAPRVERFAHKLLGIESYEYSDGRYPGFPSEIVGCHYPLSDAHVEHINRVVVGHLMLRCGNHAYFASRLDPTLTREDREKFDMQLQSLGGLFRGVGRPTYARSPLNQMLVFALAILHDIGKTAFLPDAGHEERGGALVQAVLERIQSSLGIRGDKVELGRILIENHTMLGTLVQGERSACEVLQYIRSTFPNNVRQQEFLSYLLLLNAIDLSGYRYHPIILDPYWAERYFDFSGLNTLNGYATNPEEFGLYRLRELARVDISSYGNTPGNAPFFVRCKQLYEDLDQDFRDAIGRIRIRDALYFIIDFNALASDQAGLPDSHSDKYVALFKAFADVALAAAAHTVSFCRGTNASARSVDPPRLGRLMANIRGGCPLRDLQQFVKTGNTGGLVEFTIDHDGYIAPP